MAHNNTILNQLMILISWHELEKLATKHHSGQKLRSFSRRIQFVAMTIAQFIGKRSIRDLTSNLQVQGAKLYHLGLKKVSMSTLARVKEQQPYLVYKEFFYLLLSQCKRVTPNTDLKSIRRFTCLIQQQ